MIKRISRYLLLMALVLLLGCYWLLATDSGARSAMKLVRSLMPGLTFQEQNGRLVGPLTLHEVVYDSDTLRLTIKKITIDWRPRNLWRAQLLITELLANNVQLVQRTPAEPAASEAQPFVLPNELPLPIAVEVVNLAVDNIGWQGAPGATPLHIHSVNAVLAANSDALDIRLLDIDAPSFSVNGFMRTDLASNYQTDAKLTGRIAIEDVAEVTATIVAQGDLSRMHANLKANAKTSDYGTISATAEGVANRELAMVEQLKLALDDTELVVSGEGQVDFSSRIIDTKLAWRNLQWPLPMAANTGVSSAQESNAAIQGATLIESKGGTIQLSGTLDKYSADVNADLSTTQTPNGTVLLNANGSTQHLDVHSLTLKALSGTASGTARFDWAHALKSEFNLAGEGINPGELFPQWPGSLNFTVKGTHQALVDASSPTRAGTAATDDKARHAVELEQLKMNGTLRELPVDLDAKLSSDGNTTHVDTLMAKFGSSAVTAQGVLGGQSDFNWRLESSDLGALHPQAAGAVASTGHISGALPLPVIDMTFNAKRLRYQQFAFEKIDMDAALNLASDDNSSVQVTVLGAQLPDIVLNKLSLQLDGNRSLHTAQLNSNTQYGDLQVSVSGALHNNQWQGQLLNVELDPKAMAPWVLQAPVNAVFDEQQQSVERACFISIDSRVCALASVAGSEIDGELTIDNVDLALFKNLLGPELKLTGAINGGATFSQAAQHRWQIDSQLTNSPTTLSMHNAAEQAYSELLSLKQGRITLSGNQSTIETLIDLPFVAGGGVNGSVTVSAASLTNKNSGSELATGRLQGTVDMDIPQLDFLAAFSPEVRSISGALNADIDLQGYVHQPIPKGELRVQNLAIDLSTPGLTIRDATLLATANDASVFTYSGQANSDGGLIELSGSTMLDGDNSQTQLALSGREFQIWNTPDARVWVSPNVQVAVQGQAINLTGEIAIPRAKITPKELPQSAVAVSRDQIVVTTNENGEEQTNAAQEQQVDARVTLSIGDQVEISGFGFNGRLEGELDVQQQPGKPLVASGELNVKEGEYRAYGQGLVVDRGQFLFAGGEIDNPGLSVRALRRPADGIVVGVNVRGELRQPDINLFSEPSMSSSDQLSWLVLGRPMQSATGAESDYIAQAALALGVKGGNFLTKGIGDNLGLDSIGIQTGSGEAGAASDVNQAALVIGKYITPELYVSYGVGLLESISTVKLRYLMTKRWSLITESSAISSGGDISYSFEK